MTHAVGEEQVGAGVGVVCPAAVMVVVTVMLPVRICTATSNELFLV